MAKGAIEFLEISNFVNLLKGSDKPFFILVKLGFPFDEHGDWIPVSNVHFASNPRLKNATKVELEIFEECTFIMSFLK